MKTTIWLEIHVKLSTPNKLFCRCANVQDFVNLEPNTHICPICTAQPGALPTVSMECIDRAIVLGKILNCTIQDGFYFDRKNYFYPDLPTGYQITQISRPININGQMDYRVDNYKTKCTAKITQAHLENDTAKSIHHENMTLIDRNRSGTPLVEIVTWPDFHTHEEVVEFLKELQRLIKWNNIWSADLDKGQMRVDVNISVSPNDTLGTRVEVKNINTFASIRNAINYEVSRQTELINNGGKVIQETVRRHDPSSQTISMRSKEDAHDYRYFPEPDIRPIHIVNNIHNEDSLTSWNNIYISSAIIYQMLDWWFNKEYINWLIQNQDIYIYFKLLVDKWIDAKTAAKRIVWSLMSYCANSEISTSKISLDRFEVFVQDVIKYNLKDTNAKIVLENMVTENISSQSAISKHWFDKVEELDYIWLSHQAMDANLAIVEQYRSGKTPVIMFLVWQVMKLSWGKADATAAKQALEIELAK